MHEDFQALIPTSLPTPFGSYAHGMAVSGAQRWVFTSGQLGLSKEGAIPDDVVAQTRLCFAHIEAILAEAGFNSSHIVQLRAYVTDRAYFPLYMQERDAFLGGRKVASTLLIVGGFTRAEFKVEIEAVAARA